MRAFVRCVFVGLIVLASWAAPLGRAQAANLDTTADRVLGQLTMGTGADNQGGLTARSMSGPNGAAVDPRTGRLYVADNGNNSVLEYDRPAAPEQAQAVGG